MFTKTITEVDYKVIEAEAHGPLPTLTPELKDSLRALQGHPGFQYLLHRLALERAVLRSSLETGFRLTEREMAHLQGGIYWSGWLVNTSKHLTSVPKAPERQATNVEADLFARTSEALELIG